MIDKELLDILVCPEDQTPLHLADGQVLAKLNQAIAAGQIDNQGGQAVHESLSGGLVCRDHAVLYPIIDDIPVLLVEEAISLDQIQRT